MSITALTLWQPWASLVAIGVKTYETRSWSTKHRGPLVIHAAKRVIELPLHGPTRAAMLDALEDAGIELSDLPLGKVVATCEQIDCFPVEELWPELAELGDEQYFGDYSAGRFAWPLSDIRMVDPPIPARGSQGLWQWDAYDKGS